MQNSNIVLNIKDSEISVGLLVSMIHRTYMIYLNNRMKTMDLSAS